jgi:hypothetical protein
MDDIQRSKTAAGEHIVDFFKEHQDGSLIYRNQLHTQTVVLRAEEIGDYYGLSPLDSFIVFIAACFHDTGHLVHAAGGHEEKSVELMREYFKQENIEESILLQVETCILATRLPSDPQSLCEQILCDADLYHLGTPDFLITNELVKNEIELRCHVHLTNWNELSLQFLQAHNFHTSYCREKLGEGKLHNIRFLQNIITGTNQGLQH